jgi:hypothetical protein
MDYGYQLLRHVVQQVFGNLGSAARITLPLLALPYLIFLGTNADLVSQMAQPIDPGAAQLPTPDVNILGIVLTVVTGLIGWLWAAVSWHRFVLLEEYPSGLLPTFRGDRLISYLGASLIIGLIVLLASMIMGLGIGLVTAILQNMAIAFILGVGLVFGISWIAARVGLILPSAAIGERLRVGESWSATAPVSSQIILPIIVIALVSTVVGQAVVLIFGTTVVGLLLSAVVSWLQLLVNLALMTTLYGNLIEGRQLN